MGDDRDQVQMLTWRDPRVLAASFGPAIGAVIFVAIGAHQHRDGASLLDAGWVLALIPIPLVMSWVALARLMSSLPPDGARRQAYGTWPKEPPPRDHERSTWRAAAATAPWLITVMLATKLPPAVGVTAAAVVTGGYGWWQATRSIPRELAAARRRRSTREEVSPAGGCSRRTAAAPRRARR
ncbi:hypothetical protein [Luteipulveratus flavus]|uniref:Uncharacterized protein n=1 Tax=Luteipulveratus flavus TaxID=3031728 RepID=A0ABT6C5D4_9MICO|nr:hypothetical protein [Luteipulveratus sp. YIM 133296]MDF8263537.1 hypothetical protein [Luteipulveratus sp. YIM 133296]